MTPDALYLDLLKKSLLNMIYGPDVVRGFNRDHRMRGRGLPRYAKTMIGLHALNNIQRCVETVLEEEVPGDFIETGVWRGGACILMRGILKVHGVVDRKVWVADSFQGLPHPDTERYPCDKGDTHHMRRDLVISLKQVQKNFEMYDLLDDQVKFLPGFFRDTLPSAPIEKLAVLRLDGDMYEATILALEHLYPKLSPGGFAIIDDYSLRPCRVAVDGYRTASSIDEPIEPVDPNEPQNKVYWRKR